MNWNVVSQTIEILSLVIAILTLFMDWPRLQARVKESPAIKTFWNIIFPLGILLTLIASYGIILIYTASLASQAPLPPTLGKTIAYLFLITLLFGQIFMTRVKTGAEKQRFSKQIYITIVLIFILTFSDFFAKLTAP